MIPNLALLLLTTFDVPPPAQPEATERLREHYAATIEELLAGDFARLSASQTQARVALIAALGAYRERSDFGRNLDFPDARVPYFVDAEGRRCAVAELLHSTGEEALIERVHSDDNHAWIADLRSDAEFGCWLERVGLTLEEAARIQGPVGGRRTYGPGDRGPATGPIPESPRSPPSGYSGPGDTSAPAAGGPRSDGPAAPGRPASGGTATGRPASTGGSGSGPATAPSLPGLTMSDDDSWWLWWEYNKADFLRPNRLDMLSAPLSGDDTVQALARFADSLRAVAGPALREALSDGDPRLRAAAAVSYGRTLGAAAVPRLLELLADANLEVRQCAILALGATGAPAAIEPLLAIARQGHLDGGDLERISPTAKAHAIVALGLGRRLGFSGRVDMALEAMLKERPKSERESLGCAAMIYQRLAPCEAFEELAFALAEDESEAPSVRCRAVEALATAKSEQTLTRLQGFLSCRRLDLRRSAALALGARADTLALAPLMTAFELESESLTRGFILTSIGRQGGSAAREFLLRALAGNPKSMRSWSALALGVMAHGSRDPALSKAIREAGEKESNQQARSAYWIAAGLVGDEAALPVLSKALAEAGDARSRMYAASGLALLSCEGARQALHERLPFESAPLARAAIAQSLGCYGNAQDLELISGTISNLNEPDLQALAATALAFHATFDSMRRLNELAARKDGTNLRRAAAIGGVGMILGRSVPLSLMDVSRQANYTVFNEWMDGLYQTTL